MPFAADVKAARKSTGLSQAKAAAALSEYNLDVGERTLAGWERGENEPEPIKREAVLTALRRVAEARRIQAKLGGTKESALTTEVAAPDLPPIEEVAANLRLSFGEGVPVDIATDTRGGRV